MTDRRPSRERVAVIDIGTNSTRLLIAEVADGEIATELARDSRVTRLGAGVDATGRLSEEAIARVTAVLEDYGQQIRAARPARALALMTSAVRDSANGAQFAALIATKFGLAAHILSGEQEARLTFLGATAGRAGPVRTLVIDIGGGSTELVLGRGAEICFHASLQAGVVRQSERHIRSDPPSAAELEAVADDVRYQLEAAVPTSVRSGVQLAIAVAGTPTSLAAIAQRLEPYDRTRVHGYVVDAAQRDEILRRLAGMDLPSRQRVPGLHPQRAATILPGIVILREVMALFALGEIEVSERDILHGAALALR
jgi:exopolyphosphatase/guanosine-5'-triphosphate,3'-diphosphate pyrophosphatase